MAKGNVNDRLQRLDILSARLKADEPLIVRELAQEMGVSPRTLSRDIQILRERGYPIEADRGRGGGIRLHWSWGLGQLKLSYSEAIDLLISLAVMEQMKSPLLMANLQSVKTKLMASFSMEMKHSIGKINGRIRVTETASPFVQGTYLPPDEKVTKPLHQAFVLQRCFRICYKAETGEITDRAIEPHYLLFSYPIWYILAWDQLRQDVRTFRCDRILKGDILEETYRLRPFTDFEKAMEGVNAIRP
ncbi:MAG: WYL domain-containing protein [Sneathiellales bacterium]|nr:WYL domain-containing protein [Sneathiellales bacterium]